MTSKEGSYCLTSIAVNGSDRSKSTADIVLSVRKLLFLEYGSYCSRAQQALFSHRVSYCSRA